MPKIKAYTLATCPFCIKLKAFFKENNIKFENIDVGVDKKAREEMIKKSGQIGTPVIDIDGEIIIGFEKETLKKKLGIR